MKKKILYMILFILTVLTISSCQTQDKPCAHDREDVSVINADCDSEGYTYHICRDCGLAYKTDLVAPHGHQLTSKVTAPTCTAQGYTTYTCECGYTFDTDFAEPIAHEPTSRITAPTCTAQGYTTYTCKCGYTFDTDFTEPTGHTLATRVVTSTCEAQGYEEYYCSCGYSYQINYTAPKGHSLTTKVTQPTCEAEGYTTYACSDCAYGFVSDYVIPTGHTLEMKEVVTPTSFSHGYIRYACACSYEYTDHVMSSDVYHGAYVGQTEIFAYGINLSSWDGDVDYEALKEAGIDFVILRAGTSNGKDRTFETQYLAAKAAGLDVGCYFYTYATTVDAILAEADLFLEWIDGKQFEYPVYLDVEDPSLEALDSALLTQMCTAFIERVQGEGWFCGLYVNNNWLINLLETEKITPYFDIWYARWMLSNEPTWNDEKFGDRMGLWQYTAEGTVEGHDDIVDLNVAFQDYPTLIKQYHLNGF